MKYSISYRWYRVESEDNVTEFDTYKTKEERGGEFDTINHREESVRKKRVEKSINDRECQWLEVKRILTFLHQTGQLSSEISLRASQRYFLIYPTKLMSNSK